MKLQKLLAALTAACLLLCGCQKSNTSQTSEPAQETQTEAATPLGEDPLSLRAAAETLTPPDGMESLYGAVQLPDGYAVIGNDGDIIRFSADFSQSERIKLVPLAPYDGFYEQSRFVIPGTDTIYALYVMENHNGINPKDAPEEYDQSWWDAYYESCVSEYILCSYAQDGTMTDKVKVQGLEDYKVQQGQDAYDRFSAFYQKDGRIYLALETGAILQIGTDGSVKETCTGTEDFQEFGYYQFLEDRDGRTLLYARIQSWDMTTNLSCEQQTLTEFDVQTGKPGKLIWEAKDDSSSGTPAPISGGYGEYRLFVSTGGQLLGIRDDGTTEPVIDWDASDLAPQNVLPLPDGTFLAETDNWPKAFSHLRILHKSEVTEEQILTLAVFGFASDVTKDFVRRYNATHKDVRIQIEEIKNSDGTYPDDPEGSGDAYDRLRKDLLSDQAPDMMLTYEKHDMVLRYGARGIFCDLNPFIDSDAELDRSELVPNVLTALQHPDGSLYGLTNGFGVMTMLVKEKFHVPDNWSLDDMTALYDAAENNVYQWSTKEQMLIMLLSGMDFTDEVAGTCSFDTPEFIRMLEFCNRFPAALDIPQKDYEDPAAMEALNQYYVDQLYSYQRDESFMYPCTLTSFSNCAACPLSYAKGELGGDFSYAGYPSANGQGGKITCSSEISILSKCADQNAAWEFVKAYLSTSEGTDVYDGFSLLESRFEEQLDDYMYIMDFLDNGTFGRSDTPYYHDDVDVYPLTQEERDRAEAYIRGCKTYMMVDADVLSITLEEAGMYFSGDRSAEETAKMIQSRAALLLSEQGQ